MKPKPRRPRAVTEMERSKYHGPQTVDELCAHAARKVLAMDWFFMGIFGEPGSFKSSMALEMAKKIQAITLPGAPFDPRRQVVYSDAEYEAARRILPAGSVIIRDEAIKSGSNKMRFMSKENNRTVEDVNTGRKLYHVVFEIMPFSDDEDPRLMKHMHWTARMTAKGQGVAYECRKLGFKKVRVWEEPRFEYKRSHVAETDPELWKVYEGVADDDVRGQNRGILEREERVNFYRTVARQVLSARAPAAA